MALFVSAERTAVNSPAIYRGVTRIKIYESRRDGRNVLSSLRDFGLNIEGDPVINRWAIHTTSLRDACISGLTEHRGNSFDPLSLFRAEPSERFQEFRVCHSRAEIRPPIRLVLYLYEFLTFCLGQCPTGRQFECL